MTLKIMFLFEILNCLFSSNTYYNLMGLSLRNLLNIACKLFLEFITNAVFVEFPDSQKISASAFDLSHKS